MNKIPLTEKRRQFRIAAYERAAELNYKCQVCGKKITLSGNWINDAWYFDHIKGRNRCSATEYINDFVFVCKALHEFRHTRAGNLTNDLCVTKFLNEYYICGQSFYNKFLECQE